jgi:hypothetical protein
MRLNELVNVNQRQADAQAEQAWDAWDDEIARDLKAGALDMQIAKAREEAESAEAL